MRAGAYALSLLSIPLNVQVLELLAREPKPLVALREEVGAPPQTTMRGHLKTLTELGIVERRRQNSFPGAVDYELQAAGRELVGVIGVLRDWLATAPAEPMPLPGAMSKAAIKALSDGWSSAMIRALASRPLSLTELNRLISSLNYPSLERRLGAMRHTGLIEPLPDSGRSTPYLVTDWLRRGTAPLAAAARWERRHVAARTAPIGKLDAEAILLLAVPLLGLSPHLAGSCRLAVEIRGGEGEQRIAGVLVGVRDGAVVTCTTRMEGDADAWAAGSVTGWLSALIDGDFTTLEVGGDCELAAALLDGLNGALSQVRQSV